MHEFEELIIVQKETVREVLAAFMVQLTQRQLQCLNLSLLGYKQAEIASILKISQATVNQHLAACYKKAQAIATDTYKEGML